MVLEIGEKLLILLPIKREKMLNGTINKSTLHLQAFYQ